MLARTLKEFLIMIYQRCIYLSGISTFLLGIIIQSKVISEVVYVWWIGYGLIVIGCITFIGSIIYEYKDAPKLITKAKAKIKRQRITLAERIAQEERQDAIQNKTTK